MLSQEWVRSKNRNLSIASNYQLLPHTHRGVVFFPGFSQTKAGAYGLFSQIASKVSCHDHVLLFDYSGSGDSQGESSEIDLDSMVSDSMQVVEWFDKRVHCDDYVFIGHGSGNIIASIVATQYPHARLVFLAPHFLPLCSDERYASVTAIIKEQLDFFDTADLGIWDETMDDFFAFLGGRLNRVRGICVMKRLFEQLLTFDLSKACEFHKDISAFTVGNNIVPLSLGGLMEYRIATQDPLFLDMLVREDLVMRVKDIINSPDKE